MSFCCSFTTSVTQHLFCGLSLVPGFPAGSNEGKCLPVLYCFVYLVILSFLVILHMINNMVNVNITESFTSSLAQNIYKINPKLNSDDKCLIYLLTCKQYVEETTDTFCKRWSNYKNNARKFLKGESYMQQHFFEHFQSTGHTGFVEHVHITFVYKTDPFIPTKHEDYWRQTLKSLAGTTWP